MSPALYSNDLSAVGTGREVLTPATGKPQSGDNGSALLGKIAHNTSRTPGFVIPAYDYTALTYFGSTNNVQTVVFKTGGSGGTTVATLTLAYAGGGAANDDRLTSVTLS